MRNSTRLVAGLSAFGMTAVFLTGCGAKDPDEGLCEEVTAALESRGIYHLSDTEDAVRLLQGGFPADEQLKVEEQWKGLSEKCEPFAGLTDENE